MAYGGSLNGAGPQGYGFMPTGPSQTVAIAASTVTATLSQFVTTAPYAPQCLFWNLGTDVVFAAFGSSTTTVAITSGVPIVGVLAMAKAGGSGGPGPSAMQILSTGKTSSPAQYVVIGGAGTTTVFITPGVGSR